MDEDEELQAVEALLAFLDRGRSSLSVEERQGRRLKQIARCLSPMTKRNLGSGSFDLSRMVRLEEIDQLGGPSVFSITTETNEKYAVVPNGDSVHLRRYLHTALKQNLQGLPFHHAVNRARGGDQSAYLDAWKALHKNQDQLKRLVNGPVEEHKVASRIACQVLINYGLAVRCCSGGKPGFFSATDLGYAVAEAGTADEGNGQRSLSSGCETAEDAAKHRRELVVFFTK